MNHVLKSLACALSASLFFYLMLYPYREYREGLRTENILQIQQEEKVEQEAQQKEEVQYAICLDLSNQSIYDQNIYDLVYRTVQAASGTVTIVFGDGRVPHNNDKIDVTILQNLLNVGWKVGLSGSENVKLDSGSKEELAQWEEYLTTYINNFQEIYDIKPDTYYFGEGEYYENCDPILQKLGFQYVLYYDESAKNVEKENGLTKINCMKITSVQSLEKIEKQIDDYQGVVITVSNNS